MNALATKSPMVTFQMTQLVDQQQMAQANTYSTAGTVQIGTKTMQVDEVVDRTQATVARLLGASSVERIATDRSLLAQGMDSLAGVSLYNWLGQYFGFFVPLTDILQGISIQVIAKYIFDKMEEQRQMATCVTQTNSTSMLSNNDNQKLSTNDSYSYTGMNNIIRIIQPRINSTTIQRIVFCVGMVNPSVEKTLLAQQSLLSASIYILHIPTGPSVAAETIAQMRRIQPRGPYSLVTVSKQSENIARQIIKQLEEQHQQAGVKHFLAIIDPTPLEPLEQ
jgi:acyl carrier protein